MIGFYFLKYYLKKYVFCLKSLVVLILYTKINYCKGENKMRAFEFESFEIAYPELLKALLEEGQEVSPRGMLTKEITPVGITITNPRKRIITNPARKLNHGFTVGELIWMISGRNDLSVTHYNKNWANYSDDGETLNGAYGQRIFRWDGMFDVIDESYVDEEGCTHPSYSLEHIVINQFENAFEQLKKDPDTRQATIVLFNPGQDYRETKDKPCTNLLRFTIRDGKLNMLTVMRSNDIIMGFPYDVFNFTMMQEIMAGRLGVEVGKYTHVADSLHIYEDHFEMAERIINTEHPLTYDDKFELVDARVSDDELENVMSYVYDIEASTRLNGAFIKVEDIESKLYKINNLYWRSLAAVLAIYNLRKERRPQADLDILKNYVTNEFSGTVNNWNQLS